jgi:hypothetical protein
MKSTARWHRPEHSGQREDIIMRDEDDILHRSPPLNCHTIIAVALVWWILCSALLIAALALI